jgi:hypothetical protein
MSRHWVDDYQESRGRFHDIAQRRGCPVSSLMLAGQGPAGESLTIDATSLGAPRARTVIVHLSGVHGVEGFLGGAIQHELLSDPPRLAQDCSLVLVHGVNPFGMAWLRRVNENNVDLNRNCLPWDEPPICTNGADYRTLDAWLNPRTPPGILDDFYIKGLWYLARHRHHKMRQTIAGGQHQFPRGLFYGGDQLQPSLALAQNWLRERLAGAEAVFCIDVHSGLGRYAQESFLVPYHSGSPEWQVLTDHFGRRVVGPTEGHYHTSGAVYELAERLAPDATIHSMVQEFGTYSSVHMLRMLRQENRWWWHARRDDLQHRIKQRFLRAFSPLDEQWRAAILRQGRQLVEEAIRFLSKS